MSNAASAARPGHSFEGRDHAVTVIHPRHVGVVERFREFWDYRRLIPFFGMRFLQKTYARTWLGWFWIPLRPILSVGSQVLIFGAVLGVPSNGVPYLLFFLVGMGVWQLFAICAYWATRCVELSKRFLKQLYLPRLILLLAAATPAVVDFGLYAILIAIAIGWYGISDGTMYLAVWPGLFVALAGLFLAVGLALAIGLWTSVYGAQARDVRFGLRYVLSFWFVLTPVIYPLSTVPDKYRGWMEMNPMTAPLEMVKSGLLNAGDVTLPAVLASVGWITLISATGLRFFLKSEAAAVDHL